jgi:hypothetical protein
LDFFDLFILVVFFFEPPFDFLFFPPVPLIPELLVAVDVVDTVDCVSGVLGAVEDAAGLESPSQTNGFQLILLVEVLDEVFELFILYNNTYIMFSTKTII